LFRFSLKKSIPLKAGNQQPKNGEQNMRIKFHSAPAYVCERRAYHHDAYLVIFVGLELEAKLNAEQTMYQVTLHEVLRALMRLKSMALMAIAYWSGHWDRIGLMLDQYVYFPAESCEVISSDQDRTALLV